MKVVTAKTIIELYHLGYITKDEMSRMFHLGLPHMDAVSLKDCTDIKPLCYAYLEQ